MLALCSPREPMDVPEGATVMGVDTGATLHAVLLRIPTGKGNDNRKKHLVHLEVCHTFERLDELMREHKVYRCVIDGLPETHPTREFAGRHPGRVFMSFFNEHQRGALDWNRETRMVQVNRTEALDASRAAVREKLVTLPRRDRLIETFANHLASDAKVLDEDEETGAKRFRYIKTGTNHFSLAFTYAWMAAQVRVSTGGVRVGRVNSFDWRRFDLYSHYRPGSFN